MQILKKIYQIMEKNDTKLGRFVDGFLLSLVVLNVFSVILGSYVSIRKNYEEIISIFEMCSILIFTIEYLLRLISSPYKYSNEYRGLAIIRYSITPMAVIDLMVIIPFYLPFFIGFDFRILRILRLFRLLRILKITRYSKALDLIMGVFKEKKEALALSTFILLLMIFFAGSVMYFVENNVQPNAFSNIIVSVKWVVQTMVFLGYGEIEPLTPMGEIFGMITVVLGLGWLTLPISVLSSGFIENIQQKQNKCPHCGVDLQNPGLNFETFRNQEHSYEFNTKDEF